MMAVSGAGWGSCPEQPAQLSTCRPQYLKVLPVINVTHAVPNDLSAIHLHSGERQQHLTPLQGHAQHAEPQYAAAMGLGCIFGQDRALLTAGATLEKEPMMKQFPPKKNPAAAHHEIL